MNKIFLYQLSMFWKLRTALIRSKFWLASRLFGFRYRVEDEVSNYQSFQQILSVAQSSIFTVFIFALLLQYADGYLQIYYSKFGISVPDDTDYITFLATVSGMGGVFIGLYYAGISSVSSSMYARVPNNVRNLLIQERFGNVYMRTLSITTLLSLTLIAFRISGQPRIWIAVPIVWVAGGVGVVSFAKLGFSLFNLFDPTSLSTQIFNRLEHWLNTVKVGGYRFLDKSFQAHAYKQASETIETLQTLAEITASEPHLSSKPLVDLNKILLRFLIVYENAKPNIPYDSEWYKTLYEHRDWYRADHSQTSLAYQSGTVLLPDKKADREWLEKELVPVIVNCIQINIREKKYIEVIGLLNYVDVYLEVLTSAGYAFRAFELLEKISPVALTVISAKNESDSEDGLIEKLALIEKVASLPISIALAYRKTSGNIDKGVLERYIRSIDWRSADSIYKQNFPKYFLERLEWLRLRLDFEESTEGEQVTPSWYLSELLCQIEVDQLFDNTSSLITAAIKFYSTSISAVISGSPLLAAGTMSRELEYWHKIEIQVDLWGEKWINLSEGRHIEGLPWKQLDIDKIKVEITNRKNELFKLMSGQNMLLALSPQENIPDYAGQFLHISGEVSLDALLTNNCKLFAEIFPLYLVGCVFKFIKLRPQSSDLSDWRVKNGFKIAAAVLIDAMHISGYAKLFADYHDDSEVWNTTVEAWDKLFSNEQLNFSMEAFAALVLLTESGFELPHRSILRIGWARKIGDILITIPRGEGRRRGRSFVQDVPIHKSALVRLLARDCHSYHSFYDGIDIFVAYYFSTRDGARESGFRQKKKGFAESNKFRN